MKGLQLEKGGFRGLAIAESLRTGSARATLAGIVMRRDLVIDGFVFGYATPSGDDATEAILDMHRRLHRADISYLLLLGTIISRYNIIDIAEIHRCTKVPVISVTYRDSGGIQSAMDGRFEPAKIKRYQMLGSRQRIKLGKYDIFVRCEGCTSGEAQRLLCSMTLQGSIPEPLRVARLLARAGIPGCEKYREDASG